MLYSEKVMDHFRNPRNVGEIADADGVGEVGNAKCGDIMRMYLKVSEDEIIEDVKFQTFGCASAIATSSIATDMIKGQPLSEALKLTNQAVVEALDGLPAHKIHCSVLAEEAVRAAIKDYYDNDPGEGAFQTRAGNYLRGTVIGHGNVPVKQCLSILKRAGYDDTIAIEFEGMEPALTAIRIGLANLKKYWEEA